MTKSAAAAGVVHGAFPIAAGVVVVLVVVVLLLIRMRIPILENTSTKTTTTGSVDLVAAFASNAVTRFLDF